MPTAHAETLDLGKPVVMRGAAVSQTANGFVGSTATFTITAAKNGSGHVFLDTFPLTEVDMQGSARLAARVAAQVSGKNLNDYDLFFVIRSGSTQIGGPSAGATLTVGAIAAINGWDVRPDVLDTGTIQPDGSIGPVGGIPEKAAAAAQAGIKTFLFPEGEETQPLSSQPGTSVDMVTYCRQQLGIQCAPVSDIYQAVENMTDHAFVRPAVTGNVTGAAFRDKLAPLSQELITAAAAMVDEASTEVGQVPAGNARAGLEQELAAARGTLASARSASANGTYYTAASLSFQTSISAHDARDRAKLVRAPDASAALNALVAEATRTVASARAQIEGKRVDDSSAFESVGAAQIRLIEAESRLAMSKALTMNGTDLAGAVYESAYASERSLTATWWLKLGGDAPTGKPVQPAALEQAARDAITASDETIAYVDAVFAQSSVSKSVGSALAPARRTLDEANAAQERGFSAAAMLNALDAQVRASNVLLLASFGNIPAQRVEQSRVNAARAIQEARGRGVEPLLAESEYEFGLSQADSTEQQNFLGLARVTANLAGLPDLFGAPRSESASRFQGLPRSIGVEPAWVAGGFAVGMALGVGLGLTAMTGERKRKREAQATQERWPPPPPPEHFEW